jgi:hypothetical protein
MKLVEEKINKFRDTMTKSLTDVASTKGGLNVLRYLYHESGFAGRHVVQDKRGKIDMDATFFNTARCDMYKDIRIFMTPEVIKLVELGDSTDDMVKKEEGGIK